MTILVVSNMGAKASAPFQGAFVDKQVTEISKLLPHIQYFNLNWNGDSIWHKVFKYPFFFCCFLYKYIVSFKRIDVIHVHYCFPTILCAVLYKFLRYSKVKIVVTCHGSDVYCYPAPNRIYRQCTKYVAHWIFTSAQLQNKFYQQVESPQVLSAGFDEKLFFINEINKEKPIDYLLVGSLDLNKGIDRFLNLVKSFPDKNFALVGGGALRNKVQEELKECNNFQYLGSLSSENLATIYHQTKYLLSLSRHESFGLVITEAAACGVPCIATETDGVTEQLPQWPYIVTQCNRSENDILADLRAVITQTSRINEVEYGILAKQVAENAKKHSLTEVVRKLIMLYKSLEAKTEVHTNVF